MSNQREILFRAKCAETKIWIEGLPYYNHGTGEYFISRSNGWVPTYYNPDEGESTVSTLVDVLTLGQYTGLKDKNEKMIFEGDILFGKEEGDGETTAWEDVYFEVVYDKHLCSFMAHEIKLNISSWDMQICEINNEYAIIGNIHDNPEMLVE